MFENVDSKIKGFAKVLFIIGIIASVIATVAVWLTNNEIIVFIGTFSIIVGIISLLLICWLLYGFGELISLQGASKRTLEDIKSNLNRQHGSNYDLLKDIKKAVRDINHSTVTSND